MRCPVNCVLAVGTPAREVMRQLGSAWKERVVPAPPSLAGGQGE
jgi:hypothetical protein